uniref:Cobalt transporter subunit CbtB n=1 Tax=Candidatus Kentrum eta TaxID=2126337 RepID=A0A450UPK2_9GAMM|nr:MAG: cobalt transporter subunit CbtB [Candidatus Kentron sp. H]VFJ95354.1 MAG: cobalt transporter subunit CbtB [Candidatus Kentron sp. H]VFK01598.1 MAG: cobalt transporter subunit CbtB [Candidatus Kentron sp. H]
MYTPSATTTLGKNVDAGVSARFLPSLFAALLGALLVFTSGFVQTAGFSEANVLHNAAHDARHSAGFPCH